MIAAPSLFARLFRSRAEPADPCAVCALAACRTGRRAVVVSLGCDDREAGRLRTLGLFEGTAVTVLDSRDGLLLEVRGSRLALAAALAATVIVRPLLG